MSTITISKNKTKSLGWVTIPRRVYDELLEFKKLKEFAPTAAQKKALLKAEKNLKEGKTVSYHEVASQLGFTG